MGLPMFSDSGSDSPVAPNPNPFKFKVLSQEDYGQRSVLLVKYEGCTTFEGHKLLLTRTSYSGDEELDPHLLGVDHLVMARFEPTEEGLELARYCAQVLPAKDVQLDLPDVTVYYQDTPAIRDEVFRRVIEYFKEHRAFSGESIMQMDNPQIDAPQAMADIADDIIKFREVWS
jgi:hypothetical protein